MNAAQQCMVQWDYALVKQGLLNELKKAFIATYLAQEKRILALQQLELAKEAHLCMNEKFQAGKGTILQEKKGALQAQRCSLLVDRADSALAAAKQHLAAFWQEENVDFEGVDFPFFQLDPPPPFSSLEEALTDHPALAKACCAVNAGLAATEFEETMAVPDVEITAGFEVERRCHDPDFFVSLSIPLPLFDRNQGNRARASYQAWQAAYARQNLAVELRKRLKIHHQAWCDAYKNVGAFLALEQLARDSVSASEESYKQGKIEKQEWLEAKKSWLETREQLLDLVAEYQLQKIETLHLKGEL